MSGETLVARASLYLGKQETFGINDGPNIRRWKAALGPGVASAARIPWCGIFVFNMLLERNGIDRRHLVAALGFRPGHFFPESCDSWVVEIMALAQRGSPPVPGQAIAALAPVVFVTDPRPGDLFFMMVQESDGTFSKTDAHHTGICTGFMAALIVPTIEGNTVSGSGDGQISREGDGVYRRTRTQSPGKLLFARLPVSLTGFQEAL